MGFESAFVKETSAGYPHNTTQHTLSLVSFENAVNVQKSLK